MSAISDQRSLTSGINYLLAATGIFTRSPPLSFLLPFSPDIPRIGKKDRIVLSNAPESTVCGGIRYYDEFMARITASSAWAVLFVPERASGRYV